MTYVCLKFLVSWVFANPIGIYQTKVSSMLNTNFEGMSWVKILYAMHNFISSTNYLKFLGSFCVVLITCLKDQLNFFCKRCHTNRLPMMWCLSFFLNRPRFSASMMLIIKCYTMTTLMVFPTCKALHISFSMLGSKVVVNLWPPQNVKPFFCFFNAHFVKIQGGVFLISVSLNKGFIVLSSGFLKRWPCLSSFWS